MKPRLDKWMDVFISAVAVVVTVHIATDPRNSPWGPVYGLAATLYLLGCLCWRYVKRRRVRDEVKRR